MGGHPQLLGQVQKDHRERDGQAQPPLEHLVEIGVARVGVIGPIAPKAGRCKEKGGQRGALAASPRAPAGTFACAAVARSSSRVR